MARSEASEKKLTDAGAQVVLGSVDNLDCLRRAASAADGAIHTAFYHKISHIPLGMRLRLMLGGAPNGIVLGPFAGIDNPASSRLTQERLGWRPTQPGLLTDLDQADYFKD